MAAKKETAAAAPAVSDKKKALETAMQQIEKMYGKGSIMRYGDGTVANVEAIPTGSLALDLALGIGGLPRGRVVEIYGPESSGKTTLALHVLAQAQKLGGEVAPAVGVERAERDEAATLRAERGDRLVADDAGDGGRHLGEQDGVVDALALEHGGEVRGIGAGLADGIIDLGRGAERPEPLQRAVRALGILRQVNVKVNQKLTVEHRKTPLSSCLL